ncbi:MAG: hypothetical protein ACFCGT_16030 [Sandaracinaceae bacterium]
MTEEEGQDDRQRLKKRRVTLQLTPPRLALPGEELAPEPPRDAERRSPSEPQLALPSGARGRGPSTRPPVMEMSDGWSRDRPSVSSVPPRLEEEAPAPDEGPEDGGALTLVNKRSRRSSPGFDTVTEMRDRYALGDFSTALELAELVLGRDPEHEVAQRIARGSRQRLSQLFSSRLGDLARVPEIAVDAAEVRWLGLDTRAAFLLTRVDGTSTFREIIQMSGMPRVDALKTLVELLELKAIRLADAG